MWFHTKGGLPQDSPSSWASFLKSSFGLVITRNVSLEKRFVYAAMVGVHSCFNPLAAKAFGSDTFGQGNTTIRSKNFQCQGTETRLEDCQHSVGTHYSVECGHQQDAGLACFPCNKEGVIQIVNGSTDSQGPLEICHNYQWVAICVHSWRDSEAEVACRELGLPTFGEQCHSISNMFNNFANVCVESCMLFSLDVVAIDVEGALPLSSQQAFQYNISCMGSEATLQDCKFSKEGDCVSNITAAIICPPPCENGDVRLYSNTEENEGLVLLCHEDKWYGICDQMWSTNDAVVTCHQLGYTGVG